MGEAVQKCNCGGAACKGAKVEAIVSGGGWRRENGQTVQRCNCGGAACKGAKVSEGVGVGIGVGVGKHYGWRKR